MKVGSVLIIPIVLLATVGCHRTDANLLPNDLVGFWTADEPRYQGRFLELLRPYVIIGAGPGESPQVQMVDSVESNRDGDNIVYNISSTDLSGTHYKLTLLYNPAGGGVIHFKHQENIPWRRQRENNESLNVGAKPPTPPPAASNPKSKKATH